MDVREQVENAYLRWKGHLPELMTRLPRSGSERIYFRLSDTDGDVIGAYNPGKDENDAFVGFTRHFISKGLKVPEVFVYYAEEKIYFLEDLGDTNLFTWLALRPEEKRFDGETADLMREIVHDLVKIQAEGIKGLDLTLCYPHRSFDRQSIIWDMNYFKYMFLKLVFAPFNETRLERDFERLTLFLLEAGQDYFLFRDFQTANIMVRHGVPYYIDYQGGRCGAPQYDIASLVYDSKAYVPSALRDMLIDYHAEEFHKATGKTIEEIRKYTDAFAAVRLMQALGAFGYRGLYENKPTFTESIVPAVGLLDEVLGRLSGRIDLPELAATVKAISELKRFKILQEGHEHLKINITSFSYSQGINLDKENGGGFVFDCRSLKNPGKDPEMSVLTGRDSRVTEFFASDDEALNFVLDCVNMIRNTIPLYRKKGISAINIAFGCTGGRHRSVWCADRAEALLGKTPGVEVVVCHTALEER
ncbi:MAG TPA: RNase adapter RapZ [Bacteroidales bacterium]|nr:RNase adapter RapZ [Bacteroidales bacterium]HPT11544.1 RNase adapter RapZ [Bacteroidales bacterium]